MNQSTHSKLNPHTPACSSIVSGFCSNFSQDVPKASVLIDHKLSDEDDSGIDSTNDPHDPIRRFAKLQAYFYDIYILLQRQKTDLVQLSARANGAARLIEQSDNFPGCEATSAILATLPIIECAVEANISTVSSCRDMISAVQQAVESRTEAAGTPEKPVYTPESEPCAWNIAYPGDDLFGNDENGCDDGDSEIGETGGLEDLPLPYHEDIVGFNQPKLYMPRPPADVGLQGQSRRVILSNLPPDTNLGQVLRGIRCYGGVIAATMVERLSRLEDTKGALVEFAYPIAANDFVSQLPGRPITFLDESSREYVLKAWLIPTPSYFYSRLAYTAFHHGRTRRICMPSFPIEAVWYVIGLIGVGVLNAVELNEDNSLLIEAISLFEASRIEWLFESGMLEMPGNMGSDAPFYVPDSSQGDIADIYHKNGGQISHVSADTLQKSWDVPPYNNHLPNKSFPVEADKPDVQVKTARPRTNNEILAAQFDIDPDEVDSYLEERQAFQDVTYRIVGSNISITRRKWSWGISAEDNIKLLMANTLHDPDWADEWDKHFEARGEINLRTWERYGQLAAHRRERAITQGSEEWQASTCADCPWGCRDMKAQPVPALIREFFDFDGQQMVSDEDET